MNQNKLNKQASLKPIQFILNNSLKMKQQFEKGIRIASGATLTINNSMYEFGLDAAIIIESGANLRK